VTVLPIPENNMRSGLARIVHMRAVRLREALVIAYFSEKVFVYF